MTDQELLDLSVAAKCNLNEIKALAERVKYLEIAVARGDPRFCRAEYANTDFDPAAFDEWFASRGWRVPSADEVFGVGLA